MTIPLGCLTVRGSEFGDVKFLYICFMETKRYKVRICIDEVFEIEAPDESEAKYGAWMEVGNHPEDHGNAFIEGVEELG